MAGITEDMKVIAPNGVVVGEKSQGEDGSITCEITAPDKSIERGVIAASYGGVTKRCTFSVYKIPALTSFGITSIKGYRRSRVFKFPAVFEAEIVPEIDVDKMYVETPTGWIVTRRSVSEDKKTVNFMIRTPDESREEDTLILYYNGKKIGEYKCAVLDHPNYFMGIVPRKTIAAKDEEFKFALQFEGVAGEEDIPNQLVIADEKGITAKPEAGEISPDPVFQRNKLVYTIKFKEAGEFTIKASCYDEERSTTRKVNIVVTE